MDTIYSDEDIYVVIITGSVEKAFTAGADIIEMALVGDIRIASTKAKFGQPETQLGLTPGFGDTQRLARQIDIGVAKNN